MGEKREILIELIPHGNIMKVVAVDPATGLEVVIQGPVNTPPAILKRTVLQKMKYMLEKKEGRK